MKLFALFLLVGISFLFQSCEFSCSIGKKEEIEIPENRSGRIKNDIKLEANEVKIEKAYLVFDDGKNIPDDNIVDFSKGVKMIIVVDSGWKEINGKVKLGGSEKIMVQGDVLWEEKDLFAKSFSEGISPEDARIIGMSASIKLKNEVQPLTTFLVSFEIWDKNSDASIKGSYKLFAK